MAGRPPAPRASHVTEAPPAGIGADPPEAGRRRDADPLGERVVGHPGVPCQFADDVPVDVVKVARRTAGPGTTGPWTTGPRTSGGRTRARRARCPVRPNTIRRAPH